MASIQPTLPMPTTNMTSISAQQQPTQNAPCARPRPQASRAGLRPRQCAVTCASGLWHRSRQRRFSAENWKSPAPASTSAASAQPLKVSQAEPRTAAPHRHVRGVRGQPEPGPGGEVAGGGQRDQPAAVAPRRGHPLQDRKTGSAVGSIIAVSIRSQPPT